MTAYVRRQGLDRLLAEYPDADVAVIVNQGNRDSYVRNAVEGPWTTVDLTINGELTKFAIWNYTGNVYRCDEYGAVEDDPFIVVPS